VSTRAVMMTLLNKFGNWGGAVATIDGEVLGGAYYLLAVKQMRMNARIFVIDPEVPVEEARALLQRAYGSFSYDHIDRTPWRQSFAQPHRLPGGEGVVQNESTLYHRYVLPWLKKEPGAVFDLGSGRGAYPRRLRMLGHEVVDVEFFRRALSSYHLNRPAVQAMIDDLCSHLREKGRFRHMVLEAVINSCDTTERARDVVACCAAFCKPGGLVHFSGRRKEMLERYYGSTAYASSRGNWYPMAFLDENSVTATYHRGGWFYQIYHSKAEVDAISAELGEIVQAGNTGSCWQRTVRRGPEWPVEELEAAIRREFDIAWPNGETVGRGDDVVNAWRAALEAEGQAEAVG